jgi:tetracycline 7-halogenase / FADH2 O2-dependent halogenase
VSRTDFDLVVVGSGFAGSLTAILARRLGRSVALLERGTHPRFAIGESSSPLANLLLESLCERYELPRIRPLAAWGSWQRERPEIACGLKRGFTFYGHAAGRPFAARSDRSDQLLVAASPCDEVADTHWYRPDFDAFLAREAAREGAEYLDRTEVRLAGFESATAVLETERFGRERTIRAQLLVDATGPGGFLHRSLSLGRSDFPGLPATSGLYAHFTGVHRVDEMGIDPSNETPPYPPDDAALHHVFDGGWIWVLRFNNGIVSAGVAAEPWLAHEIGLAEGEPAWHRLLDRLPMVRAQFDGAETVTPFIHRETLPFRSRVASGEGWLLLPSAAAFVDPILSTGFPLTLLGVERLASALERCWGTPALACDLARDAAACLAEADTAALLVAALYSRFDEFPSFAGLSLLYFAAASYAEAARRLGRPELSGSFLSGDHARFGPALAECCALALSGAERSVLDRKIRDTIAPLDVVGLSDRSRRNWYPVLAEDLLSARGKLGAGDDEIRELLDRSGVVAASGPATGAEGRLRRA